MRLITAALILFLAYPTYAIRILQVKSTKVLLDLEGDSVNIGDRLGARDSSGKARGLMEIRQIKNNRAVAEVTKGRVEDSYSVARLGGSGASKASTAKATTPQKPTGSMAGFLVGMANNSMSVETSGGSISMSGSSFSVSGFYQMNIDGAFNARVLGSYENLSVSGGTCSTGECKADISYLGIEALIQWAFVQNSSMDLWVGGGLGFLFAMSKESNVIDTSKVSTNQTIVGSLGLDYKLSRDSYIPVQFDYAVYPANASSSASQMILRIGYGFSF